MSLYEHKGMSQRSIGMWASNNSDRSEDIFAENYVNHQEPDIEGGVSDKNLGVWKELVSEYHKSFSNSKVLVLMQIAEGDLVATRWEFTATHVGDFMGLAPTGREVTWNLRRSCASVEPRSKIGHAFVNSSVKPPRCVWCDSV
jgi:predicted ester cyclase